MGEGETCTGPRGAGRAWGQFPGALTTPTVWLTSYQGYFEKMFHFFQSFPRQRGLRLENWISWNPAWSFVDDGGWVEVLGLGTPPLFNQGGPTCFV